MASGGSNDPQQQVVTELHPSDVLFGRGSGPNDHEGNIFFRELVAQRKAEYMATNHRQTKAKIARAIVETVFSNGGRFLKKLEPSEIQAFGLHAGTDAYVIADDDTIMEKAKQALRQNRDKHSKESSESTTTTTTTSTTTSTTTTTSTSSKGASGLGGSISSGRPPLAVSPTSPARGGGTDVYAKPQLAAEAYAKYAESPSTDDDFYPEPLMMSSIGLQPQIAEESEDDYEFNTYTTTLADPPESSTLRSRRESLTMPDAMAARMGYAINMGGTRRGSLLGGRRDSTGPTQYSGRRDSLQLADVWRRDSILGNRVESMQMSDLMESFKGMSTGGENTEFNSSSDTIGTIEPIGGNAHMSGLSNMSVMSMASSSTLFKTESGEFEPIQPLRERSGSSDGRDRSDSSDMTWGSIRDNPLLNMPPGQPVSRQSITHHDLWNERRSVNHMLATQVEGSSATINHLMQAPIESSTNINLMDDSHSPEHMSSISMLRSAYGSSTNVNTSGLYGSTNMHTVFDINNAREKNILPREK